MTQNIADPRAEQRNLLNLYLNNAVYPSCIGVHGPPNTGKSLILRQVLESKSANFTWIQCDQCPTVRIALQRALRSILESTGTGTAKDAVCENVDVFYTVIARHFQAHSFTDQYVVVLDRIDKLPDSPNDLYSCFPRLPELIDLDNLLVVFVYSTPEPRHLISFPIPHVLFPRYTNDEAIQLLASFNLQEFDIQIPKLLVEHDVVGYWNQYIRVVVSALSPYTGTDLRLLRRIMSRLWPQFVEGLDSTDFNQQYVKKSYLFRNEDFIDRLSDPKSTESSGLSLDNNEKYMLCAAYLASYNSPRYDMRFFSRARDARAKRRVTKPKLTVQIPARSLVAPHFELERLLAIYHALLPTADSYVPSVEAGTYLATLHFQNMILREGDALDSRAKWKVNVSWTFVQKIAREIELPIEHYMFE